MKNKRKQTVYGDNSVIVTLDGKISLCFFIEEIKLILPF